MNFDDLLWRYFGTSDLSEVSPAVLEAGTDRLRVDLGLERDRQRRFALWSVLYLLGHARPLLGPVGNLALADAESGPHVA